MTRAIECADQPLCSSYQLVLIQLLSAQSDEGECRSDYPMTWAIGVLADGSYEYLGIWVGEGYGADEQRTILADLKLRGVEKIRYVFGPGGSDAATAIPRRRVLASLEVADELQRLASRAVGRHGPFESTVDAVSFVAGVLRRAEERLGNVSVEQAVAQFAGRVRRGTPERGGAAPMFAR